MKIYAFKSAAPTHDDVWRMFCTIAGREVQKREHRPSADRNATLDWQAAERTGNLLLAGGSTTFYHGHAYIRVHTLMRADKIFTSGNSRSLHNDMAQVMSRLGGEAEERNRIR